MDTRICPLCGAFLDPGERCDCVENEMLPDAGTSESIKEDVIRESDTVIIPQYREYCKTF